MNWQPIETAPKDGTAILAYVPPNKYDVGIHLVSWTNSCLHGYRSKKFFGWCIPHTEDEDSWLYEIDTPTYRMPLPEPPE